MKKLSIDEVRKRQIDILDDVTAFCDKNNIGYWLDHGTLIGAVRHKGYIPWDDDADIGMFRADYERFIREYQGSSADYSVKCLIYDKNHFNAFAKVVDNSTVLVEGRYVYGVYIDVFPYDNAPADESECRRIYEKRDRIVRRWEKAQAKHKIQGSWHKAAVKYLERYWFRIVPARCYVKAIDKNARKYNNTDTQYVGDFTGQARYRLKKELFDPLIEADFEGKKYKIPSGYDAILTERYGDYMSFPPVSEQINKHHFAAFLKEAADTDDDIRDYLRANFNL